jgi:hypothetical protein
MTAKAGHKVSRKRSDSGTIKGVDSFTVLVLGSKYGDDGSHYY